jgi:hypothetical protein
MVLTNFNGKVMIGDYEKSVSRHNSCFARDYEINGDIYSCWYLYGSWASTTPWDYIMYILSGLD